MQSHKLNIQLTGETVCNEFNCPLLAYQLLSMYARAHVISTKSGGEIEHPVRYCKSLAARNGKEAQQKE